jgi:anion-transporting  ArsA/GET3 family ATPase
LCGYPKASNTRLALFIDPDQETFMSVTKARGARSARNVETQKKKARRVIPRKAVSINLGNTIGARTKAKKAAGKRIADKAKAAAAAAK